MAIVVTNRVATGLNPGSAFPYTSSSFTPNNNSLLIVALHGIGELSLSFPVFTVSGGSLTWTKRVTQRYGGDYDSFVDLWYAEVTTAASMSISVSFVGSMVYDTGNFSISCVDVTGYDSVGTFFGLTAADSVAAATSHSGPLTISLGGTTASDSAVLAFLTGDGDYGDAAITGTAGYTAIFNHQGGTSGWFKSNDQYKIGALSDADFGSWTSAYGHSAYAVEIIAASGGGSTDSLTASNFAGASPSLGAPAMTVKRNLSATAFAGASPGLGTPTLSVIRNLTATSFAGAAASIGAPTVTQRHGLTATAFAGASPAIGPATITQKHALTATAFAGAAASVGAPTLSIAGQIAAVAFAGAAPSLGSPALAQKHGLTATAFAGASPVIGTPTLAQHHSLSATTFAGASPSLGAPVLSIAGTIAAVPFAGASPSLGAPALTQRHALSGAAITGASPGLASPALAQKHVLIATSFAGAAADIGRPIVGDNAPVDLTAQDFTGASPGIGMAYFSVRKPRPRPGRTLARETPRVRSLGRTLQRVRSLGG